MTERKTKVFTVFAQDIQLIVRDIFTHPVTSMLGEPEFFGDGVKIHTDAVTNARCDAFELRCCRINA